jgi:ABC-2 type transport system permease protein
MIKIAIKDLKLFMAEKRSMILTFIVPIPLITLFSLAFGGMGKSNDVRKLPLVLCDEDHTSASRHLVAQLDSLSALKLYITSTDTANSLIGKGKEDAALVLHKGFKDSLEQGRNLPLELRYDQAKEIQMGMLMSVLSGNLMRFVGTHSLERKAIVRFDRQNPGMDSAMKAGVHQMISSNFSGGGGSPNEAMLKATPLAAQPENSPGLVQAVAGTAVMMLLFSVAGLGASLLQEKEEGTLRKLLFSPLGATNILFGKMLSANIIAMVQLAIMFTFSWLAFGLNIKQNIPGLLIMIVATAFACSGFGIFLASFVKTRAQVQGLTTLIVLTMSAIGGSMMPSFVMPLWMQKMALFSVNYWSIQGFYDLYWRVLPITDPVFLSRVGMLFAIGLVLNIAAVRMFKKNILNIA